ncbi:MAG: N-acetylneuraminate synthase family protein [Crocinitomicaceae bacterium]|nr:N-acetylneuraminate synthase family protein [Crocinitomicaceae bacterium]
MENFFNQLKNIVLSSKTFDRIVVVGKGNSIQKIATSTYENAFVINLNDSEKIQVGDLCLFYSDWVIKSLEKSGYNCPYYITSVETACLVDNLKDKSILTEFHPQSFESFDKLVSSFNSRDFVLSDFLILSALKIANLIAQIKNKRLQVYLIGFDFFVQKDAVIQDLSGHEIAFKNILFSTQKAYLGFLKDYINENGAIEVIHVGELDFSEQSVQSYNANFAIQVSPKEEQFNFEQAYKTLLHKVYHEDYVIVVAELTNNHLGDEERLRKMVRLAKEAGADLIKVQKRDVASFYSADELKTTYKSPFGTTLEHYRAGVELNDQLFAVLIEECMANKIGWFASVLDYPSFEYIQKFHPLLIKLPSTISNHKEYLTQVANEFEGDLVVSTGFTDKSYEEFVLSTFLENRNLFLLQCTSSYPAPPESCQIGVVRHYDELSEQHNFANLIAGYSSHDIGSLGCMMAVAAGAKMIEKHVKLGNVEWVHFDGVALDLSDGTFKEFVKDVRKAQLMTGSKIKQIHHQEHHKYKVNK